MVPIVMHKLDCGGRPCNPGEGNLKGYKHWSQPYEDTPLSATLLKHPPHTPNGPHYEALIEAARNVHRRKFVIISTADFDYRFLAENWHVAMKRAAQPALLYALDNEVGAHLHARGIQVCSPTCPPCRHPADCAAQLTACSLTHFVVDRRLSTAPPT